MLLINNVLIEKKTHFVQNTFEWNRWEIVQACKKRCDILRKIGSSSNIKEKEIV